MGRFGVDYSYSRDTIDIAAMARDGVTFACRYLRDGPTRTGKKLLPEEAARLIAAGIAVVSNDETTGVQYRRGYGGGVADAGAAHAAHIRAGAPKTRPIYFTPLDHDPAGLTAAEWALLRDYARGVHDVLGTRAGWYGGTKLLQDFQQRGLGHWWWQALGWRTGWDGRLIDTEAEAQAEGWHIQQYDNGNQRWGGEVDYDRALADDFGQWGATQEDDMPGPAAWTPEDWKAYDEHYNGGPGDRIIHYLDHGKDTDGSSDHHRAIRGDIASVKALVLPLADDQAKLEAAIETARFDPGLLVAAFQQALANQGVTIQAEVDHELLQEDVKTALRELVS